MLHRSIDSAAKLFSAYHVMVGTPPRPRGEQEGAAGLFFGLTVDDEVLGGRSGGGGRQPNLPQGRQMAYWCGFSVAARLDCFLG